MAEEKKATKPTEEVVSKAEYDALAKDYQRVVAAFNTAIRMMANTYADSLAKSILEEVDKANSK